jgi:hypothetical protein
MDAVRREDGARMCCRQRSDGIPVARVRGTHDDALHTRSHRRSQHRLGMRACVQVRVCIDEAVPAVAVLPRASGVGGSVGGGSVRDSGSGSGSGVPCPSSCTDIHSACAWCRARFVPFGRYSCARRRGRGRASI